MFSLTSATSLPAYISCPQQIPPYVSSLQSVQSKIVEWEDQHQRPFPSKLKDQLQDALLTVEHQLVLVDNEITSLPEVFEEFIVLKKISLILPCLQTLPRSFAGLKSLQRLQLIQCRELTEVNLTEIPWLSRLDVFEGHSLRRLGLPQKSFVHLHFIDCPSLPSFFRTISSRAQVRSGMNNCLISLAQTISSDEKVYNVAFAHFHLIGKNKPFSAIVKVETIKASRSGVKTVYRLSDLANRVNSCVLSLYSCGEKAKKTFDRISKVMELSPESTKHCALIQGELLKAHLIIRDRAEKGYLFEDYSQGDLFDVLDRLCNKEQSFSISFENKRRIALSLLSTLKELHEKNLSHRDIKPDNIFLKEEEGELIAGIGDFDGLVEPVYLRKKLKSCLSELIAFLTDPVKRVITSQNELYRSILDHIAYSVIYGFAHTRNYIPSTLASYIRMQLDDPKLQGLKSRFLDSYGIFDADPALEDEEVISYLVEIGLLSSQIYDRCAMGICIALLFLDYNLSSTDHALSNIFYLGNQPVFLRQENRTIIHIKERSAVLNALQEAGLSEQQADLLMRMMEPYTLLVYRNTTGIQEAFDGMPTLEEMVNIFTN